MFIAIKIGIQSQILRLKDIFWGNVKMEDNTNILLEDGHYVLLEGNIFRGNVKMEDNTNILLEDGQYVLLEGAV